MNEITTNTKKILTRVQLVNWHRFDNEIYPIVDNDQMFDENGKYILDEGVVTILNGGQGSGKSTVMDAIMYILTTDNRNFNKASDGKRRTLKSYIKGELGVEGKMCMRSGMIVSYVALEWHEEHDNQWFVMGVQITLTKDDGAPRERWFCQNGRLEDFSFIINGKPAVDNQFTCKRKPVEFMDTDNEARDIFRRRLGKLREAFHKTIIKGLAFSGSKQNIQDFVKASILDKNDIDIRCLRESLESAYALRENLRLIKKEVEELEDIIKRANDITAKERSILVTEFVIRLAQIETLNAKIIKCEEEIRAEESRIEIYNKEIDDFTSEKSNLEKELIVKRVALENNEITRILEQLKEKIESCKKEVKKTTDAVEMLRRYISNVRNVMNVLPELKERYSSILEMTEPSMTMSQEDRIITATRFEEDLKSARNRTMNEKFQLDFKRTETENECNKLKTEVEYLKKQIKTYPHGVMRLKGLIENEFKNLGYETSVYVLADVLEITDEKWRNAIEGYLGFKRFYLLIDPKYYDMATEIYNNHRKEIDSAGLIDIQKIRAAVSGEINPQSLAAVITSNNSDAYNYAVYVLNRVIRCDSVKELKEHNISVTAGCMLYQGYVLGKIHDSLWKTPYIGAEATKILLGIREKEYTEKQQALKEIKEKLTKLNRINTTLEGYAPNILQNYVYAPIELSKALHNLETAENEREEYEKNNDMSSYFSLQEDIKKTEQRIKDIENSRNLHIQKLAESETNKKHQESEAKIANAQKDLLEEEFSGMSEGKEDVLKEAEDTFSERMAVLKDTEILKRNYEQYFNNLNTQKLNLTEALKATQRNFKAGDLGIGMEEITNYIQHYNKLKDGAAVDIEEQLKQMEINAEANFREEFLSALRAHIEGAIKFKNMLNKTLKGLECAGRTYQFVFEPAKDKKRFYNMIMDEKNNGSATLLSYGFEEEFKKEIEELYEILRITDEKNDTLKDFIDYRNYLEYDIKITTSNDEIIYLSRKGGDSGGEGEISYYIIIIAAFIYLYQHGETARPVLIDEAFLHCDKTACRDLLNFIKTYKLQLILSSPEDKQEHIIPLIDNIISFTKITESYSEVEIISRDKLLERKRKLMEEPA